MNNKNDWKTKLGKKLIQQANRQKVSNIKQHNEKHTEICVS